MLRLSSAVFLGALAVHLPAAAGWAATIGRALPNGVALWTSTLGGSETVTVRVEVGVGLAHEAAALEERGGLVAVLGAALERGAVGPFAAGELERLAQEAGLTTRVDLEYDSLALVLSGPPQALARALWISAQRLSGPSLRREDMPAVRDGLWSGVEGQRLEAIGPAGDAFDTVASRILGPAWGHTAYASRRVASSLDDEALGRRLELASQAGVVRVFVVCPPEVQSGLDAILDQYFGGLPRRAPAPDLGGRERAARPQIAAPLELPNPLDHRHLLVVGWDLRGAGRRAGLDRVTEDAALLTLVELLQHRGGLLHEPLVDAHGRARALDVRLQLDAVGVLLIAAESRDRDTGEARALIAAEIAGISSGALSPLLTRAAAEAARVQLATAWNQPEGRAEMLATLVRSARLQGGDAPEAWLERLAAALDGMQPSTLQRFGLLALAPAEQVVAQFVPADPDGDDAIAVDSEVLGMYLRVMVDIRCPTPARPRLALADLLDKKYGLDARRYVDLSRAISRQGDALRELSHEADQRCQEYAKLRGLLTYERVVELHRLLACGPGRQPAEAKREVLTSKIFERFDLDPSAYRPLLAMWREDLDAAQRLRAVESECGPKFGPAGPP